MITPIAGSVMREAFGQAPVGEREGALALGGTRWGMIRSVVLPFGRGAMIGGLMLGLGRALGETMAVLLIISPVYAIQPHILEHGTSSISSLIASAVRRGREQLLDQRADGGGPRAVRDHHAGELRRGADRVQVPFRRAERGVSR